MTFDKDFWEEHWRQRTTGSGMEGSPPNPYLVRGTGSLTPGTALDAGCGAGAEAIWLASQGWQVTAADISADALQRASRRATDGGVSQQVQWVEADLTVWSPDTQYDLVTTHYAHPAMPQLAFYKRISNWVAPGGTLLIVGHQQHHGAAPPCRSDGRGGGHRRRYWTPPRGRSSPRKNTTAHSPAARTTRAPLATRASCGMSSSRPFGGGPRDGEPGG